ncbi:hypothetical protein [Vulcanisaeta sp. JCM 14467]|uniref:hypothetical protein n=1 Tax=Vulcanisaeta sp. JCM 14467 TaxID=1295370 RepID=UPI002091EABF|nr:hypothetical protein [Vulcanisaeta sp. JCM 14467]
MAYLSAEELAKLLGEIPEVEPASVGDIIRVVVRARADKDFRDLLMSYLERYLGEYIRSVGKQWVVTEDDINEFVRVKKLEGVTEKTIRDEVHYIREALAEMN